MFKKQERPEHLYFEIGGVMKDYEVEPLFPFSILHFKQQMKEDCRLILLTELEYSSGDIKTKEIQESYMDLASQKLEPDLILVREPYELPKKFKDDRKHVEKKLPKCSQ